MLVLNNNEWASQRHRKRDDYSLPVHRAGSAVVSAVQQPKRLVTVFPSCL